MRTLHLSSCFLAVSLLLIGCADSNPVETPGPQSSPGDDMTSAPGNTSQGSNQTSHNTSSPSTPSNDDPGNTTPSEPMMTAPNATTPPGNTSAANATPGNTTATGNTDPGDPIYQNTCDQGPLDAPIAGCAPAPLPSTGDPHEDCVRRINQLRWECQCLGPLERWTEAEDCADRQAAADAASGMAHGAWRDGICQPKGRAQNECPRWGSWDRAVNGCLQMMWDEGPGDDFLAHGHYLNMTNPAHSKVACGGADGWFVQNFR